MAKQLPTPKSVLNELGIQLVWTGGVEEREMMMEYKGKRIGTPTVSSLEFNKNLYRAVKKGFGIDCKNLLTC